MHLAALPISPSLTSRTLIPHSPLTSQYPHTSPPLILHNSLITHSLYTSSPSYFTGSSLHTHIPHSTAIPRTARHLPVSQSQSSRTIPHSLFIPYSSSIPHSFHTSRLFPIYHRHPPFLTGPSIPYRPPYLTRLGPQGLNGRFLPCS